MEVGKSEPMAAATGIQLEVEACHSLRPPNLVTNAKVFSDDDHRHVQTCPTTKTCCITPDVAAQMSMSLSTCAKGSS